MRLAIRSGVGLDGTDRTNADPDLTSFVASRSSWNALPITWATWELWLETWVFCPAPPTAGESAESTST